MPKAVKLRQYGGPKQVFKGRPTTCPDKYWWRWWSFHLALLFFTANAGGMGVDKR